MNKYHEALGNLVYKATKDNDGIIDQEWMDEVEEDSKKIQELVDRATPKKPIAFSFSNISGYECPDENCGALLEGMKQHCSDCGQALDWTE